MRVNWVINKLVRNCGVGVSVPVASGVDSKENAERLSSIGFGRFKKKGAATRQDYMGIYQWK